MSKIAFANKICTAIFLFYLFVLPTMVGMTMIFYWSCLALLDLWSALLTLCVALLLVESRYPDHFLFSTIQSFMAGFFCVLILPDE